MMRQLIIILIWVMTLLMVALITGYYTNHIITNEAQQAQKGGYFQPYHY